MINEHATAPEKVEDVIDAAVEKALATEGGAGEIDPFKDIQSLRLTQNFATSISKKQTRLVVRKPKKQSFVRTHDDKRTWFQCYILGIEDTEDKYIVTSNIAGELEGEVKPVILIPTISREDTTPFVWPVPLPGEDGKINEWHASALDGAELARTKWTRVWCKSFSVGQYEVIEATKQFPEPEWPAYTVEDYMRLAFKDRVIASMDHFVIKRLRGEE